jgi:hypothetical protein
VTGTLSCPQSSHPSHLRMERRFMGVGGMGIGHSRPPKDPPSHRRSQRVLGGDSMGAACSLASAPSSWKREDSASKKLACLLLPAWTLTQPQSCCGENRSAGEIQEEGRAGTREGVMKHRAFKAPHECEGCLHSLDDPTRHSSGAPPMLFPAHCSPGGTF